MSVAEAEVGAVRRGVGRVTSLRVGVLRLYLVGYIGRVNRSSQSRGRIWFHSCVHRVHHHINGPHSKISLSLRVLSSSRDMAAREPLGPTSARFTPSATVRDHSLAAVEGWHCVGSSGPSARREVTECLRIEMRTAVGRLG